MKKIGIIIIFILLIVIVVSLTMYLSKKLIKVVYEKDSYFKGFIGRRTIIDIYNNRKITVEEYINGHLESKKKRKLNRQEYEHLVELILEIENSKTEKKEEDTTSIESISSDMISITEYIELNKKIVIKKRR